MKVSFLFLYVSVSLQSVWGQTNNILGGTAILRTDSYSDSVASTEQSVVTYGAESKSDLQFYLDLNAVCSHLTLAGLHGRIPVKGESRPDKYIPGRVHPEIISRFVTSERILDFRGSHKLYAYWDFKKNSLFHLSRALSLQKNNKRPNHSRNSIGLKKD